MAWGKEKEPDEIGPLGLVQCPTYGSQFCHNNSLLLDSSSPCAMQPVGGTGSLVLRGSLTREEPSGVVAPLSHVQEAGRKQCLEERKVPFTHALRLCGAAVIVLFLQLGCLLGIPASIAPLIHCHGQPGPGTLYVWLLAVGAQNTEAPWNSSCLLACTLTRCCDGLARRCLKEQIQLLVFFPKNQPPPSLSESRFALRWEGRTAQVSRL